MVLGIAWFAQGGQTPPVAPRCGCGPSCLAAALAGLPVLGPILGEGLLGHNAWSIWRCRWCRLSWWLLYRTRFGLRLRAVGENPTWWMPRACRSRGLRYAALTLNGMLVWPGRQLPGAGAERLVSCRNMTAGRGFMALAALIFGKLASGGRLWACLLFGFLDAVAIRLQGVQLARHRRGAGAGHPGLALCADGGAAGRLHRPSVAPAELAAVPYVKER